MLAHIVLLFGMAMKITGVSQTQCALRDPGLQLNPALNLWPKSPEF